jgi:hypothetical protein
MIKIKLLEFRNEESRIFNSYSKLKEALNKVVGHTVEIVYEQDSLFEGYYLVPVSGWETAMYSKELLNKKSFLLSVINLHVESFIDAFQPAGIINWRHFIKASTSIIGNRRALEAQGYSEDDSGLDSNDYTYISLIPSDDTFETTAKSILKYLEIYDNYLKAIRK